MSGFDRKALSTVDRSEAEQLAKQLMATLLKRDDYEVVSRELRMCAPALPSREVISLRSLWERYSKQCDEFLDNVALTRADTERSVQYLMQVFGTERDVATFSPRDIAQYVVRRRRGGLRRLAPKDRTSSTTTTNATTGPVRQSAIHHDLSVLRSMLRWACTVVNEDGRSRWLDRNPLDGIRFQQERSPRRAVASLQRYEATRAAVRQFAINEQRPRYQPRWIRLELALFLAHTTGRRRGAIAGLQWGDVDFTQRRITWRAENDKKRVEWITPMASDTLDELRQFQRRLGTISGPLFPSKRHPSGHIPAAMLDQWLRDAEQRANLPKLPGGLWHPYRRGWATARMHFPLKAVADAGGWKDVTTLVRCYQHTNDELLLAVMTNDRSATTSPHQISGSSIVT